MAAGHWRASYTAIGPNAQVVFTVLISTMSEVDKLTDEFKLLKGEDDIDAELEAMRKEIAGPKQPIGELPEGRKVDEAIEKELRDLKNE